MTRTEGTAYRSLFSLYRDRIYLQDERGIKWNLLLMW